MLFLVYQDGKKFHRIVYHGIELCFNIEERNHMIHRIWHTQFRKKLQQFVEEEDPVLANTNTFLQYHTSLNPILWTPDQRLRPDVREHILRIAELWRDFSKIPPNSVQNIILVGGSANYNWTPYSDLDIHLVMNRSVLGNNPDVIEEYIKTKKNLFTKNHHIALYGIPVELYAQDISTPYPPDQGVYDVTKDMWIVHPTYRKHVSFDDPHLLHKVRMYTSYIIHLMTINAPDSYFEEFKEKLRRIRSSSIQQHGEYGFGNLLFKSLRNSGILQKMTDFLVTREDANLSLS